MSVRCDRRVVLVDDADETELSIEYDRDRESTGDVTVYTVTLPESRYLFVSRADLVELIVGLSELLAEHPDK